MSLPACLQSEMQDTYFPKYIYVERDIRFFSFRESVPPKGRFVARARKKRFVLFVLVFRLDYLTSSKSFYIEYVRV